MIIGGFFYLGYYHQDEIYVFYRENILKNLPKQNKEYAEKQLDLIYDDFMKYTEYMTEKYYRNGFVDGVQLIKGCCDSSRPF